MQASLSLSFAHRLGITPMSVASDGSVYYTINGGNAAAGEIERYNLSGSFLDSVLTNQDSRTLVRNNANGQYYTKNYGRDWFQVNPSTGVLTAVHTGIFSQNQSSPALTPDGTTIFENYSGTVNVIDASSGGTIRTLTGLVGTYDVATDGYYIFAWIASSRTVHVYDFQGNELTNFTIPSGSNGYSLSYANGLLWAEGSGVWYGYRLTVVP